MAGEEEEEEKKEGEEGTRTQDGEGGVGKRLPSPLSPPRAVQLAESSPPLAARLSVHPSPRKAWGGEAGILTGRDAGSRSISGSALPLPHCWSRGRRGRQRRGGSPARGGMQEWGGQWAAPPNVLHAGGR